MLPEIAVPFHADDKNWLILCFQCDKTLAEGTWWHIQEQMRIHKSTNEDFAQHSITIQKRGIQPGKLPSSYVEIPQHSTAPDWIVECQDCHLLRGMGTWWHVMEQKRAHLKRPYRQCEGHDVRIMKG